MSNDDTTYRIVYDSFAKRYEVERRPPKSYYEWTYLAQFRFKWFAERCIKGWIKYDEAQKVRTREVVWGPYP